MKSIYSIILCLLLVSFLAKSQESKNWTTFMSYNSTTLVEESVDKVFAVADGSLFSYGKEDNSVKQYFKGNPLSDTGISFIRWNQKTQSLLIVYKNSNIDIMKDGNIKNIPYLNTNTSLNAKTVNNIFIYDDYAFLSTDFGIMVVNMNKYEIKDTYNISIPITSCTILGNEIFATTTSTDKYTNGLLKAPLDGNLLDPGIWKGFSIVGYEGVVNEVITFKNSLLYSIKGKGVGYVKNDALQWLVFNPSVVKIKIVNDKFVFLSTSQVFIFSSFSEFDQINNFSINDISSYQTDKFWTAEGEKGLCSIKRTGNNKFEAVGEPLVINGPYVNSPYRVLFKNEKLYLIPGGKEITNGVSFNFWGNIMIYENEKWSTLKGADIYNTQKILPKDYTSIYVDNSNPENETIYASCFGVGVVKYTNRKDPVLLTPDNTLLENISGNSGFCRIDGFTSDKNGNLWMTNSQVNYGIKVLDKDGKWHQIYSPYLSRDIYTLNNIFITSANDKWVNVPRPAEQKRIVVIAESSSLDEASSYLYESFTDTDGNNFAPTLFSCMAEDKNGYVWVGSNKGCIYFTNPKLAATENNGGLRCTRIKMISEENGEPYYFLDNVLVTCIKIDAGNRKWIGTQGNGVYVLGNNNDEVIHQFDTSNSPLPSDYVYSIDINDNTGEVFIGTNSGLVSYKGEATEGKSDYSDIYAFPNPVKPENEKVTITGLMDNSTVKITDLNGNILYQTTSVGGQISWNCRNKSGNRVVTGVYLVLAATQNSSESVVTKIAVVK